MKDGFTSLAQQTFDNLNFTMSNFANGVETDVKEEEIRRWMANPEANKDKLAKYAMYQYISNGDIFQLFDLARVSPSLNYKIKPIKVSTKSNKNILNCRKALKELNHKELTRDIISQTISNGTLVGLWVGGETDDETPYLMIFDDLEHFFPGVRKRGKWTVWCDLEYFDGVFEDDEKAIMLESLSPHVTMNDYKNYKTKGEEYRFIEFPIERSVCIRTHTLKRNQRFGIPWNTQAVEDIKHKQKLRNLEKVASNKVMNAVAVLTLGLHEPGGKGKSGYKDLGEKMTKDVFTSVKTGLMNNKEGEASVVGIPEWAKLEYPQQKTDVLDPDKMISVNEDVNNSTGVARTLTNGKGGNYASAKLNLDILFTKIGELLEHIENEVYNKLFSILIKGDEGKDYYLEYEKTVPLTNKEKLDMLHKLVSLGYSLRPLVEILGLDFDEYINNSIYEIDKLKLREKIVPPMSTYTSTSDDISGGGATDSENQNTVASNESDSNNTPKV